MATTRKNKTTAPVKSEMTKADHEAVQGVNTKAMPKDAKEDTDMKAKSIKDLMNEVEQEEENTLNTGEETVTEGDTNPKTEGDDMTDSTEENTAEVKVIETDEETGVTVLSGIPIPTGRSGGQRASKYKWDELSVGESFFVPKAKSSTFNTLCSTRNKKNKEQEGEKGKQYIGRTYEHEGVKGVMVWRTK